jgi:hypothetical protein
MKKNHASPPFSKVKNISKSAKKAHALLPSSRIKKIKNNLQIIKNEKIKHAPP